MLEIRLRNTRKSTTRHGHSPKRGAHGSVCSKFNSGTLFHSLTGLIIQYRGSIHRIPGTDRGVTIRAGNLQLAGDNVRCLNTDRHFSPSRHDTSKPNMICDGKTVVTITGGFLYMHLPPLTPARDLLWRVHCPCLPTITRPPDTSSARANRWLNTGSAQCF